MLLVPEGAFRYLLLQRTDYLVLPKRKLPFRVICKLSIRSPLMTAVALESRWRKRSIRQQFDADMQGEYESIRSWLPEDAKTVLDIGCGLGGIDVLLYRHFGSTKEMSLYLVDRTQTDQRIHYGYRESADYYNSFEMTRVFLVLNGVPETSLVMLEARDDAGLQVPEPVDLIVSLISWGFHYPVATYLDRSHELLHNGGRLIIDVRKGTGGVEQIKKKYGNATVIAEGPKRLRVVATR
jgi:SAM-dependent methyltransferase